MNSMCNCSQCLSERNDSLTLTTTMILCPICGNKRCPHATDHRLVCTNSNASGQQGSSYGVPLVSQVSHHLPSKGTGFLSDLVDEMSHLTAEPEIDIESANLCSCAQCLQDRSDHTPRMVLCAICGNKRCPHATDHRIACTHSNEPGQQGSSYGEPLHSQVSENIPNSAQDRWSHFLKVVGTHRVEEPAALSETSPEFSQKVFDSMVGLLKKDSTNLENLAVWLESKGKLGETEYQDAANAIRELMTLKKSV